MNNKVAVVVGATGGIGSAVARKLAQTGTKRFHWKLIFNRKAIYSSKLNYIVAY